MTTSDRPFFSIIIPTYNREDFILNTLDSVFAQTFTDYEIIVVDNCSTDGTIEKISTLVDAGRIQLIVNDQNYERAKSRNVGMAHAKGAYLTFLDSDDFMYPDNLADAHDYCVDNKSTKIFHNLYELVDHNRNAIYKYTFRPIKNARKQISKGNFLSCIGVFIHQDIYQSIWWDESPIMTGSEDYDYWIRVIAEHPNVGRINKINSGILHHDQRTINNQLVEKTRERFDYMIKVLCSNQSLVQQYGKYFKNIPSTLWIFQAGLYIESSMRKEARKLLLQIFNNDKTVIFRKNYLSLLVKSTIA